MFVEGWRKEEREGRSRFCKRETAEIERLSANKHLQNPTSEGFYLIYSGIVSDFLIPVVKMKLEKD